MGYEYQRKLVWREMVIWRLKYLDVWQGFRMIKDNQPPHWGAEVVEGLMFTEDRRCYGYVMGAMEME